MMTEGDMAYELAEYEYLHAPFQYLLDAYTDQWQDSDPLDKAMDKAWKNLLDFWTSKTPQDIRTAYFKMKGEQGYDYD